MASHAIVLRTIMLKILTSLGECNLIWQSVYRYYRVYLCINVNYFYSNVSSQVPDSSYLLDPFNSLANADIQI